MNVENKIWDKSAIVCLFFFLVLLNEVGLEHNNLYCCVISVDSCSIFAMSCL